MGIQGLIDFPDMSDHLTMLFVGPMAEIQSKNRYALDHQFFKSFIGAGSRPHSGYDFGVVIRH